MRAPGRANLLEDELRPERVGALSERLEERSDHGARADALRPFVDGKLATSANGSLPPRNTAGLPNQDPFGLGAALFLAQAYGVSLGLVTQGVIVFTALVTSIGVAGIPSASLVAIAIILAAVGLPMEAIAVLFVFDRVLDMARTSVNVFGDSCCAVIVARLENEKVAEEIVAG